MQPVRDESSRTGCGAPRHLFRSDGMHPMTRVSSLLLGLAFLPQLAHADQAAASACVEALEQLATLHTATPVYKLADDGAHHYLADADRPALIARLEGIVDQSCSADAATRRAEDSEAERLHAARSPGCLEQREILARMEQRGSRTPRSDLAQQRERVAAECPTVGLSNVWLIDWTTNVSSRPRS